MKDENKTKKQLIHELAELRSQNAGLEKTRKELAVIKIAADEVSEFAESIINTVREPLIALDQDLRVVTASRSFYEFFKVKPEETLGKLIYDLGNKQWDIPRLRELLETILPEKATFDNYEVEHDFVTIGRRIMLLNARQIRRVLGKEQVILLAIEDITEQKRLEKLLTESEERYRHLFETASDGIVLLEKSEGKITHANPATEKMLGYTNKDSIGNSLQDIGISLNMEKFQTTLRNLNKRGILHYDNVPVISKSGQHIDTDIYLVDRARLVQCNIRDITERKQAGEALRQSEENFRCSLDDSPMGVRIVTEKGETVYANRTILNIYGYDSMEELNSTPVKNRYTPGSYADYLIRREKRQQGIDVLPEYEINIVKKNGEVRCLSTHRREILWNGEKQFQVLYTDITEHKQAEETLKRSEEKYRTLFEAESDAIIIINEETANIIDANEAALQLYGYSYEEITALKAMDLSAEPEKTRITIQVHGKSFVPVRCHRKKDGTVFVVEIASNDFKLNGFRTNVSAIRDITGRNQAEEALRKSQEQLREAHRLAHIGVWNWVAETDTVLWTEELYNIAGLDPMFPAPTYAEHSNIYAPESWDLLKKAVERAMKTDEQYQLELKLIRPDGTTRWVNTFGGPAYDSHGRIYGLYGTLWDITDRKQLEESLRESEERYKALFERSLESVYLCDFEGNFIDANDAALTLLGYTKKDIKSLNLLSLLTDDQISLAFETIEKIIKTGSQEKLVEFKLKRKDGEYVYVESMGAIIYREGKPYAIQGIARNITARKQAEDKLKSSEQQLRDLAERLQQIREEERVLIAREIHDVMGGGLTGFKMDISWLMHNVKKTESYKEHDELMSKFLSINENIDFMIKEARRISTGLRPPFIDDLGLISAIDWELSEFTSRTGILHELTTQFEHVNMEKDKAVGVFRIFQEMLINVMRHSRATKIVVVLREEDERRLFGDENLVLEIRDNGRGITEDEILDKKSLGLLGMKERALAFGGEFSVRGEPGGGTTVVLKIPRKKGEAS